MELERWRGKEEGREREKNRALPEKQKAQKKCLLQAFGSQECIISQDAKLDLSRLSLLIIRYLTQHPSFLSRLIGLREATHQSNEISTGVLGAFLRKACVWVTNTNDPARSSLVLGGVSQPAGCIIFPKSLNRVCHTEWSKSQREKQIQYANTYIWNLRKKKKRSWRT